MSMNNPYNQYKQTVVQTASPEKLLLMLYDGAIKFANQAIKGIEEKNIEQTNNYIGKTQDIIDELMINLNMDYEVSKNLFRLYEYLNWRLTEANIKKDKNIIDEVLSHLVELRETWSQAAIKVKNEQVSVSGGVNIEG